VNVDEPGQEPQSRGVNLCLPLNATEIPDGDNAFSAQPNVGSIRLRARTIKNLRPPNNNIKIHRLILPQPPPPPPSHRIPTPATAFDPSPHRVYPKREPNSPQSRFGHPSFWVQNTPASVPEIPLFRHILFPCKPLSRKWRESPIENSSTYAKPPGSIPETAPQPSLGCLRTAIGSISVRRPVELGCEGEGFGILGICVGV